MNTGCVNQSQEPLSSSHNTNYPLDGTVVGIDFFLSKSMMVPLSGSHNTNYPLDGAVVGIDIFLSKSLMVSYDFLMVVKNLGKPIP